MSSNLFNHKFYVYAYLRSKDSTTCNALKGSPHYIGKGSGDRAWVKHHGNIHKPIDNKNIIIMEANLSEVGALALERRYIEWYGRKNTGTGILINLTNGGDGVSGAIRTNEHIEKIKKASIEFYQTKYGEEFTCGFHVPEIREKIVATLQANYGVNTPLESPIIFEKTRVAFKAKYGVENPSQVEEFQNKKCETSLKNYGVEYYTQTDESKENYKQKSIEKYGVDNAFKSKDVMDAIHEECMINHGVKFHQSRPEIREKISKAHKGKIKTKEHRENLSKAQKGLVSALDTITGLKVKITKELYDSDLRYVGSTAKIRKFAHKETGDIIHCYVRDIRVASGMYRLIQKS